jgi:hypothetical protein
VEFKREISTTKDGRNRRHRPPRSHVSFGLPARTMTQSTQGRWSSR